MEGFRVESINLSDINKNKLYFNPGCAMSIYKPESEHKILKILNNEFGTVKMHSICCKHDPQLPKGSTIINNCAGCDRRFRTLYKDIKTVSLWEVLDSLESLVLPSYDRLTVSIQDSCSYRPKPQVHKAVRNILAKMNINIIESEYAGTSSICCGDNFYPKLAIEEVNRLQKKRGLQMPCQDVVVYCVSCIKSMTIAEKTAHHLLDLVLEEATLPQETNLDIYHAALDAYIEEH